jgi:DNA mismatch endonuclease (patch repair protein)
VGTGRPMKLPPSPPPSSATATMRANRSTDTGPELALRRALHRDGYRYRVGLRLQLPTRTVRPDIVFARHRVAVFVDGCFWHSCPEHGTCPKDPTGYWRAKLRRNHDRDGLVDEALHAAGWTVVHVWEHEPVSAAVAIVGGVLHAQRATSAVRQR